MSGARILIGVLVLAGGLLYLALSGAGDSDLQRGIEETDAAFAAVEEQLLLLDGDYEKVIGREGLKLTLRAQHENLSASLAALRDERLDLERDASIPRRERLPKMRELIGRSDLLLVEVVTFRRRVAARAAFLDAAEPLLERARVLRDELGLADFADEELRTRATSLAAELADLTQSAAAAEVTMNKNPGQGEILASATLSGLRTLVEAQESLLAEVER